MANPTQKGLDLAYMIQEELAQRLGPAGANVTGGVGEVKFDTDGNPWFQIGTPGTTNKGGVIKVQPTPWTLAKDILGNAAIQYTPHEILLSTETNSVAGTDVNTADVLLAIIGVICLKGCKVLWYKTAAATVPAVSGGVNGTLTATFNPHIQYPLVMQQ